MVSLSFTGLGKFRRKKKIIYHTLRIQITNTLIAIYNRNRYLTMNDSEFVCFAEFIVWRSSYLLGQTKTKALAQKVFCER